MDRFPSCKIHGAVGLVAVDLIGSIFGCGGRRRSRSKSRTVGSLMGYSRLQGRSSHSTRNCVKLTPIKNCQERDDSADQEDELTVLQRQHPRSSLSSDISSKRWTSSTDHYGHRRRRGYYCMRLRIVNMMRIVALMRKVRLAYRRMTNAAAASKTILSLADLYNDIADLIPVPCSGNNDGHTIVVIRPITCAPGPSQHNAGAERPELTCGQGLSARPSSTKGRNMAVRPSANPDAISTSGTSKVVAGRMPSSWRKFSFRKLSCVCTSSATSCASLLPSQDYP